MYAEKRAFLYYYTCVFRSIRSVCLSNIFVSSFVYSNSKFARDQIAIVIVVVVVVVVVIVCRCSSSSLISVTICFIHIKITVYVYVASV